MSSVTAASRARSRPGEVPDLPELSKVWSRARGNTVFLVAQSMEARLTIHSCSSAETVEMNAKSAS